MQNSKTLERFEPLNRNEEIVIKSMKKICER